MIVAIYKKRDGVIDRFCNAPPSMILLQCQNDEDFYLNCPPGATYIINNEPVTVPPPPPTPAELLCNIRSTRNALLANSDWTQLADAPLSPDIKAAWALYRQELRDFPSSCDLSSPVWPTHLAS